MTSPFTDFAPPGGPVDTGAHPAFRHFSDANFSEVAPDRLSPLAWSVLGPSMEAAFRDLYVSIVPGLGPAVHTDRYAFVAYVGAKPYHSVDALLGIVPYVLGVRATDVAELYLQNLDVTRFATTPRPKSTVAPAMVRAVRRFAALELRVDAGDRAVTALEEACDEGVPLVPSVARALQDALDKAWSAHVDATSFSAVLVSWAGILGQRALPRDWAAWRWAFLSPDELPWQAFGRLPGASGDTYLDEPFYEIGSRDPAWADVAPAATSPAASDPSLSSMPSFAEERDVLLRQLPVLRRTPLDVLAAQARSMIWTRERAKSIAMRAQHVARRLVTAVVGSREGWATATLAELARGEFEHPARTATVLEAVATPMPSHWRRAATSRRLPDRVAASRAIAAAPGRATGIACTAEQPTAGGILIVERADSPLMGVIASSSGVVCARGSLLSHVAIICRSLGVPAVVNVPDALVRFPPGSVVHVDGDTGEVWSS